VRALYFEKTGSLDGLRLQERPRPTPGSEEALVEIRAAAINPSDPKNVMGKMSETKAPRIPGRDFAGVVLEGPSAWKGKEVFGTGGHLGFSRDGTHAEFAAIPVAALVEKPKELGFGPAAALGLSYLTAWTAIVDAGQLTGNDTLLVLGAGGAVGSSAVKIARHRGARRILGTLRAESERPRVASIPADDWIALDRDPLPKGVLERTDGLGADLILDVLGGAGFQSVSRSLAHRGRHVVIASSPPEVTLDLVEFYHREARLIGVDSLKLSYEQSARTLKELLPLVNAGILTPPEIQTVPLEQAIDSYRAVLEGTARKKVVIEPRPA
jgi:NADPH2:quinone reductase